MSRRVLVVTHEPVPDAFVSGIYFPELEVDDADVGASGPVRPSKPSKKGAKALAALTVLRLHRARVPRYLRLAVARGLLPDIDPSELVVVGVVDPADLLLARAYFRKELGDRLQESQRVKALYLVPQYGVSLSDVAPLQDAGLVPAGRAAKMMELSQEGMDIVVRVKKTGQLVRRLTVGDLLAADLGDLLKAEIVGAATEVREEDASGLCARAAEQWRAGQAFLITARPVLPSGSERPGKPPRGRRRLTADAALKEEAEDARAQLQELIAKGASIDAAVGFLEQELPMMGTDCLARQEQGGD